MNIYNDLQRILEEFLGKPKNDVNDDGQIQFPCPRCIETKGEKEAIKYNLEINFRKNVFQCWSCAQHDDEMHGSVIKLIKLFGNSEILKQYKDTIYAFKESKLYELHFTKSDFNIENSQSLPEELSLPTNFIKIKERNFIPKNVMNYLKKRNIGFDIINAYDIGYTKYDENNKQASSRIILPSFNEYGELNYWTGRDITGLPFRQKYFNPKVERKDIIFNEDKIQWDADITLVEGPFDHIVVPNSIPLLGKALKTDFKIYQSIVKKSNANINIWLDNDAYSDAKKIYSLLNHGRLYGKIRIIVNDSDKDPSEIYEKQGAKGIIQSLKNTTTLLECQYIS